MDFCLAVWREEYLRQRNLLDAKMRRYAKVQDRPGHRAEALAILLEGLVTLSKHLLSYEGLSRPRYAKIAEGYLQEAKRLGRVF